MRTATKRTIDRTNIVTMYADPSIKIFEIAEANRVSRAMVNKVVHMDAPHLFGLRKPGRDQSFDRQALIRDVEKGYSVTMAAQRHGICRETASRVVNGRAR